MPAAARELVPTPPGGGEGISILAEDEAAPDEPEDTTPPEEPIPANVPSNDNAAFDIDLNQVLELAASLRAAGA